MKSKIDLIKELYCIREMQRLAEFRENQIREELQAYGEEVIQGGGYICRLKHSVKMDIDKQKLALEKGAEFLSRYLTKTDCVKIEIIKDQAA